MARAFDSSPDRMDRIGCDDEHAIGRQRIDDPGTRERPESRQHADARATFATEPEARQTHAIARAAPEPIARMQMPREHIAAIARLGVMAHRERSDGPGFVDDVDV